MRSLRVQEKDLVKLLDVGGHVVMREHDTFGLARRSAGKNNRGDVFKTCLVLGSRVLLRRFEAEASTPAQRRGVRGNAAFALDPQGRSSPQVAAHARVRERREP